MNRITPSARSWTPRSRLRTMAAATSLVFVVAAVMTPAVQGGALAARVVPKYQFGINTYFTYNCQGTTLIDQWAQTEINQYKALGANSIGLSFPIYTDSITSNVVFAKTVCGDQSYQSPSPELLASVIDLAHAAGLQVFIRPLIDQSNLFKTKGWWRGILNPTDQKAWFASYLGALRPYLIVAQSQHAEHFAIETELDSLLSSKGWSSAIALAKVLYKGDLVWNYSWDTGVAKKAQPSTSMGVDAYPKVPAATIKWTPTQLLGAWDRLLRKKGPYYLPKPSTVGIDEVGILSQDGAYASPFLGSMSFKLHPFNQAIQAHWFAAACLFTKQHSMKGIYYWGPWLGNNDGSMLTVPTPTQSSNIQPAAQVAIKHCFTS